MDCSIDTPVIGANEVDREPKQWLEEAAAALVKLVNSDKRVDLVKGFTCNEIAIQLATQRRNQSVPIDDESRAIDRFGHEIVALCNGHWDGLPEERAWLIIHPINTFVAVSRRIAPNWSH